MRHVSDCAIHNAPAYPAGQCDCGYDAGWNDALEKAATVAGPQIYIREHQGLWLKKRIDIAQKILTLRRGRSIDSPQS